MQEANRLVVVSGVGCPQDVIDQTADDICNYYQARDAEAFTYFNANRSPGRLASSLEYGVDVVTHSAGMMAIHSVLDASPQHIPSSLIALCPPTPRSKSSLVFNGAKTMLYHLNQMFIEDDSDLIRRHCRMAGAFALGGSLKDTSRLAEISEYNSMEEAFEINHRHNLPVGLVAAKQDEYFPARLGHNLYLENQVAYYEVEGEHDSSLIDPVTTLAATSILSFINSQAQSSQSLVIDQDLD